MFERFYALKSKVEIMLLQLEKDDLCQNFSVMKKNVLSN